MTLYHIEGDVGSGKTLLTTLLAMETDRPVHANYHIKIPNFNYLNPEDLIDIEITDETPSRMIIVDEGYNWLESRLSGRKMNLFMGYILFQSRKRGIDFYLTDQLFSTIDIRFRQMTNYEIYCEQTKTGFSYVIDKISRFHRYKPKKLFLSSKNAEKIFPLYDSWETINPVDDELLFSVTKDKTKIMSEVDKIAVELIKKFPPNKITKGIVSNHCTRNNIPKSYIDLIYNSVKESELSNN